MSDIGEGIAPPAEEREEPPKEKKRITVRFSLFFDGTLNNRVNVEHREKNSDIYQKHKGQGSYENDKSNIAKMEPYVIAAQGYDRTFKAYIEGPGTVDEEKDKLRGYAFGTGGVGLKAKVKKGLSKVVDEIREKIGDKHNTIITKFTLDVFGFSRGAAGARNCIHEALHGNDPLKDRLQALGFEVEKIDICFAGLYDTVSSHGINFSNDVRALRLDAIRYAAQVIQLAAAEEYREKFALTEIQSAGNKGRQFFLPGAHSDIGGGYRDGEPETQLLGVAYHHGGIEHLREERRRLIAAGWYKEAEITLDEIAPAATAVAGDVPEVDTPAGFLRAERKSVSNAYARIPLYIMARFARQSGISFMAEIERDEAVRNELRGVQQRLDAYIASTASSRPEDWHGNDPWHRNLRHKYLHFSAREELGHGPRWEDGELKRKFFDDRKRSLFGG